MGMDIAYEDGADMDEEFEEVPTEQQCGEFPFDATCFERHPIALDFFPRSLQLFCIHRNPWKKSHTLSDEIRSLLTLNQDLEKEFFDYIRALESPQYVGSAMFNEVILTRYFMIFTVTRLQMAKYFLEQTAMDGEQLAVLEVCLEAWLSYTRSCL